MPPYFANTTRSPAFSSIAARWPVPNAAKPLVLPTSGVRQALDSQNREVLVFEAEWVLQYTLEKNPHIDFRESM